MIMPTDKDYISTKKIKQGVSSIQKQFKPLAEWIDATYNVKTLNILFDYIQKNKSHPRLQICLEYTKDKEKFIDQEYNFDKIKQQEIAQQFNRLISKHKPNWIQQILGLAFKTNNLFVYFSDFESIAKMEANGKIPEKEILELKSALNDSEIWEIAPRFDCATYFLYTEKQAEKYLNSETHKLWNEKYFNLLKKYDEFNYFREDDFIIFIDSKENFDTNYNSNWYYYYK